MSYEELLNELKRKARADVQAEVDELKARLESFEGRNWETREVLLTSGLSILLGTIFGALVF